MFRISDAWTEPSIGSNLRRLLTVWESTCERGEEPLSVKTRATYKTTKYSAFLMSDPGKIAVGLETQDHPGLMLYV